jgi:hypothetical protein
MDGGKLRTQATARPVPDCWIVRFCWTLRGFGSFGITLLVTFLKKNYLNNMKTERVIK